MRILKQHFSLERNITLYEGAINYIIVIFDGKNEKYYKYKTSEIAEEKFISFLSNL